MNPVIVHADYCRRRWSNDLPILPADGLCFPRQSHSSYHLDAFSSTWNINGVHTFHRRTRRKYQGTCGGPYVLRHHPTPHLRDNLSRWRSEPSANKPPHWPTRGVSSEISLRLPTSTGST